MKTIRRCYWLRGRVRVARVSETARGNPIRCGFHFVFGINCNNNSNYLQQRLVQLSEEQRKRNKRNTLTATAEGKQKIVIDSPNKCDTIYPQSLRWFHSDHSNFNQTLDSAHFSFRHFQTSFIFRILGSAHFHRRSTLEWSFQWSSLVSVNWNDSLFSPAFAIRSPFRQFVEQSIAVATAFVFIRGKFRSSRFPPSNLGNYLWRRWMPESKYRTTRNSVFRSPETKRKNGQTQQMRWINFELSVCFTYANIIIQCCRNSQE